jgi:hypothetical protein
VINWRPTNGQDCGTRTVKVTTAILASAVAFAAPAKATDGNFQSVLTEAGCPNAKVDKISDRGGTITYRANCFSSSHKVIIVTCVNGVCAGGHATYDDERDERG